MPFRNTMVPSRSSPRIANVFFAQLHDSHAKRPARCERLRCLHRDSAHWASARCFVKATEPRDSCNDATSLSCCFRVKRTPHFEFGKFCLLLRTALGEVAVRPVAGVHQWRCNTNRRLCHSEKIHAFCMAPDLLRNLSACAKTPFALDN